MSNTPTQTHTDTHIQLFATKGNYSSSFGQTDPKTKWIEGTESPPTAGSESPPTLRAATSNNEAPQGHHLSSSCPPAVGAQQPQESLSPPVSRDPPLTPPPQHHVHRDSAEEVLFRASLHDGVLFLIMFILYHQAGTTSREFHSSRCASFISMIHSAFITDNFGCSTRTKMQKLRSKTVQNCSRGIVSRIWQAQAL